jgi:hypothetical protein
MVAFLEDLAAILKKHDASLCYSDYHCEICARTNSNMGVMFLGEAIAHDSKKLNNLIKDLK